MTDTHRTVWMAMEMIWLMHEIHWEQLNKGNPKCHRLPHFVAPLWKINACSSILEYLKYSERVVFVGPLQTAAGKASLHPQGTGSPGVAELGHTTERNKSRHKASLSRGTFRGARKLPNGLGCFRHSTPAGSRRG